MHVGSGIVRNRLFKTNTKVRDLATSGNKTGMAMTTRRKHVIFFPVKHNTDSTFVKNNTVTRLLKTRTNTGYMTKH